MVQTFNTWQVPGETVADCVKIEVETRKRDFEHLLGCLKSNIPQN